MKSSAEFECDCDTKTTFDYRMPAMFRPTFTDVTCRGCQSVWTVRFRKNDRGETTFTFKITKPSRKLCEIFEKKKQHKEAHAPVKKAPQFFLS